ncbi:hypothetical protein BDQ12DRAFT_321953 [Crucibulum laeve]|uniref:BTB domain-containing protein n=1 Tax=Crucibulum laeve TaxID=68775 RepID=A0A5C3LTC8_9AGAR|nr:hypothetical protein BDQ12DRAFT_321953 [Crucibulum laeve]
MDSSFSSQEESPRPASKHQEDKRTTASTSIREEPYETPHRSTEFWFHDGSIVLSVQSKRFRVHQTILANHSEVFSDLFNVPQPPTGEQTIEGCLVVELHDSAEDFIELLNAIYHPSYFDNLPPEPPVDTLVTFIAPLLRLSTKYLIRTLRTRCINLLYTKFPATFAQYTAKCQSSMHTRERYKSETVMRAVHLAHECNLPALLPYLYYCVARMGSGRILKKREGDISWELKATCLVGRERLYQARMALSHTFLLAFTPSPACQTHLCAHARGPHAEWHILEATEKAPNPLRSYTRWGQLHVCIDCIEECKRRHEGGRKEVWERLPGLFGLEGWEELWKVQGM